jgi:GIY-YIG catalytic domain-containing protein
VAVGSEVASLIREHLVELNECSPLHTEQLGAPVYIYALLDPDTQEVRYIGKSIRPAERYVNHLNEHSNTHRCHWIQSLRKRGLEPDCCILERIEGAWPWQEAERYYIAHYRRMGCKLVNGTSGGDGVEGLSDESADRRNATWIGRRHRPETLAKLSQASKGRKHSAEFRARRSAMFKGRKITWTGKIAEANRKLTDEDCARIRERLAAGEKNRTLAAEYGVHRTTISKVKMGKYK